MKQFVGFIIAGVVGGLLVLGGMRMLMPQTNSDVFGINSTTNGQLVSNPNRLNVGKELPDNFTDAADKAMPAVVHISALQKNSKSKDRDDDFDLFRDFFENPYSDRGPRGGTGSGVIIKANGYIVTNNHVVEDADEIEVTLYDNRQFKAKLIGTDPNTDLAVLKIEGDDFPSMDYGNSDNVKVGEWVLAVGNPFNLTSTVTAGIVSALGRNIDILQERYKIESFIQTDAAVNPGNSGGALVDTKGNLIGINTAIASRTGTFSGYSFAIPANFVSKIVDDIIEYGEPQRGFLGISIQDLDNEIANDLGIEITKGVHVIEVSPEGAAYEAGLKRDDIIIGVNGKEIKNSPKLQELIGRGRPGEEVSILINRDGREKTFKVILRKG
jgi:Do/DeqQ family serine protease